MSQLLNNKSLNLDSITLNRWEELRNYNNYEIICYDDYNVDIRNKTNKCLLCGSYNFISELKITLNNCYYICHIRTNDGKKIKKMFHRLVMEHYFPQQDKSLVIDHIDQNKLNNNLKNLRWTTTAINNMNISKVDFVNELPDDAILCDNTILKTMRPVYFSETTKQFYEQCEGKYKICKWTKDYKLTFASNEGSGKRINIRVGGLDKLGISLTKEEIDNMNNEKEIKSEETNDSSKSNVNEENFYTRFANIDQTKYEWEPLRFFEDNYEVAIIDGYGVIRRVNYKNSKLKPKIIVGKFSKGLHVHRFLMNNNSPVKEREYRYAKILAIHYYPIEGYSLDDYDKLSIKKGFIKVKDLNLNTTKYSNSIKQSTQSCKIVNELPSNSIQITTYKSDGGKVYTLQNIYFCKSNNSLYEKDNLGNFYKREWIDGSCKININGHQITISLFNIYKQYIIKNKSN